ncbi:putative ribosomal protein L5 eukaryotic/L18 archaeal [Rosa chinensis]|uniref:Putative ribosomal protein L5 eukaryotic/L18 archaeal n=1 Tax=Rosa chinensis TaxID=74649 RepID=A0A2P6QD41_ROSCH|nr:putative ribosomal protein L5 eukaryotic/L18 archaeal [Rosa chinensis]
MEFAPICFRFAGFSKDNKQLDAEVHHKYIYGGHVAACMRTVMEDEPEKYQSHLSEYIKKGIVADNIEEIYKKVHAAIKVDPAMKKSEKPQHSEHKSIISIASQLIYKIKKINKKNKKTKKKQHKYNFIY